MRRFRLFVIGVCASLPSTAAAQFLEPDIRVIHTLTGTPGSGFGWAVAGLTDITGDGVMEVIIPSPGAAANTGRVDVFNGATGALIPHLALVGTTAGGRFGHAIADAGDMNDDSVADVIVGAQATAPGGRIEVYSGATGGILRQLNAFAAGDNFGYAVSGAGDLNADGFDDIIVGAPDHDATGTSAGRVYVFSGINGAILRFHDGEAATDRLGCGVCSVGDINSDTVPDYAAAAHGAGPANRGRAYIWSGATGQLLLPPLDADPTGITFGDFFIGPAGDVNRDGTPDLYVGDYSDSRAYVFSGKTGARVHTFIQPGQGLGCGRSAGDVNGDGHADLIVGAYASSAGGSQAGRAYLYDGRTGSVLRTITSTLPGIQFGFDAVGMGDADGDGKLDFLIGASAGSRAYVIAGTHTVCYPNCDGSSTSPLLTANDFLCFINAYAASSAYANCDDSIGEPALTGNDFLCFVNRFAGGCS